MRRMEKLEEKVIKMDLDQLLRFIIFTFKLKVFLIVFD